MTDILNLVYAYVKSGVDTLEKIGVGSIRYYGKSAEDILCIVYNVDNQDYIIRIEPVLDKSQPEQKEEPVVEEPVVEE